MPSSAGGTADIAARLLAEAMRDDLGQAVVVDNRTGATGLIGVAAVANAPPDAYTVLMTARSYHVMAHLAQANSPVDPPRDLAPVGLACSRSSPCHWPRRVRSGTRRCSVCLIGTGYGSHDLAFWMGLAVPKATPPN